MTNCVILCWDQRQGHDYQWSRSLSPGDSQITVCREERLDWISTSRLRSFLVDSLHLMLMVFRKTTASVTQEWYNLFSGARQWYWCQDDRLNLGQINQVPILNVRLRLGPRTASQAFLCLTECKQSRQELLWPSSRFSSHLSQVSL